MQGEFLDYTLPTIIDTNIGQTLTISADDETGTAYVFTYFFQSVIRIQPKENIDAYSYLVEISDGFEIATYSLDVVAIPSIVYPSYIATNKGPPYFSELIEPIILELGEQQTYHLPQIADPDNEQVIVTAILKDAALFAHFNNASLTFTFNPSEQGTDTNSNPLTAKYQFSILVKERVSIIVPQNATNDSQISQSHEVHNTTSKTYKCDIKIIHVSRSGIFSLKITSANSVAAEIIARNLNESDLEVTIQEAQRVQIKIQEIPESKLLQIKMNLHNQEDFSQGVELDAITVRVVQNITQKIELGQALLQKGTTARAQIPIQYSESKKNTMKHKHSILDQMKIVALLKDMERPTMITVLTVSIFVQLLLYSQVHSQCLQWICHALYLEHDE
ncbi:hypothetical protein FGO68_gene9501 [Halteria grandinella]|uniref:Uncharacterized protein n=1 Tax=Halteria grandinella TaxID=5974 RepID=A0A8J8T9A7_HALGN|nr:hypothetical protein FGO68_gene9501 [Halteria grandinella]